MGLITTFLAMRMAENALAKNGQIGYVEQGKVIAWDGDTTGLEVESIASGRLGYKVSNDVVDLTKVTKITDINGELTPDRYSFDQYDNVQQILDESGYAIIRAYMDVPNTDGNIEKGVFFDDDIRSIELSETIVPIDPKYLATEIKLEDYGINLQEIFFGESRSVDVSGTIALWEKINQCKSFVLTCDFDMGIPETITIAPNNYFRNAVRGYIGEVGFNVTIDIGLGAVNVFVVIRNKDIDDNPAYGDTTNISFSVFGGS